MDTKWALLDCWDAISNDSRTDWKALTYSSNNCICEMLIIAISLTCLIFVSILLCLYIKTFRKKIFYKAFTFYTLIFMTVLSFLQIIHFLIKMEQMVRTQLSFLEIFVKNIGMFLAFYSVFKKALKPLKQEKNQWLKTVWTIFFVGLVINIGMLVYMEVRVFNVYFDKSIEGVNEQY